MIRKLKSGQFRLYSQKKDPKTGKRRNLGTFNTRSAAKNMNERFNISSGTDDQSRHAALKLLVHPEEWSKGILSKLSEPVKYCLDVVPPWVQFA